jgi:hypothetical protein
MRTLWFLAASGPRLVPLLILLIFTATGTSFAQWQWAAQAGGDPGFLGNYGVAIRGAPNGNIVFAGIAGRTGAFGFSTIKSDSLWCDSLWMVLGSYGQDGTRHWIKTVGQPDRFLGTNDLFLAIDSNSAIYLVGREPNAIERFSAAGDSLASLTDSGLTPQRLAATEKHLFIAGYGSVEKTDYTGQRIWRTSLSKNDTTKFSMSISGITALTLGGVVVAGECSSRYAGKSLTIGDSTFYSRGSYDGFLVCLDSTGAITWTAFFGGSGDDEILALSSSPDGRIYAAGFFENRAQINGTVLGSRGGKDVMLIQFNSNGTLGFVKSFGSGIADDCCLDMAVDQSARVWLTGSIGDSAILDGRLLRTSGSCDAYALCFAASGAAQSAAFLGGSTYDKGCAIACINGDVTITGCFSGTVNAGATILSGQPANYFDLFVADIDQSQAIAISQFPVIPGGVAYHGPRYASGYKEYPSICVDLLGRRLDLNAQHFGCQTIVHTYRARDDGAGPRWKKELVVK